jgi:NADH-quinone oxidoreductase subunit E
MAARRLAEHQPENFAFTAENRAWAERQIARFPPGRQASAVIPILWRAQEQEGWVTKPAIESVAGMLDMPLIRVLEVATFYTMFHLEPVGTNAHVQVCGTTPCMLRGAGELIEICRRRINHEPHHRSADGRLSWEEVECAGACVNAPMIQVSRDTYEDLTPAIFERLLDAFEQGEFPPPGPQNGRHTSMPITGLTSLKDIQYAEDDVPPPRPAGTAHRAKVSEAASPGAAPAGGTNPATPAAAGQHIGRVDPTGRADEAAARAPGGGAARKVADTHVSGERNPGAKSDRDSSDPTKRR